MMGRRVESNRHRHWGLIGAGLLIGIWALGSASITQAAEQAQPEKATVVAPAAPASSSEAAAPVELAQVIAQSNVESRVNALEKRVQELEKWVARQISMKKQHMKDDDALLNGLGNVGF